MYLAGEEMMVRLFSLKQFPVGLRWLVGLLGLFLFLMDSVILGKVVSSLS